MKPGRGKAKGRSFENEVAKLLTEWSGVTWKRVPMSGGWHKDIITGDIFCSAEYEKGSTIRVPISIEIKKQESFNIMHLFKETTGLVDSWWEQAITDAKKASKVPVVIFSKNYCPVFIIVPTKLLNRISNLYKKRGLFDNLCQIRCFLKGEAVTILLLDDFLEKVEFKVLLQV